MLEFDISGNHYRSGKLGALQQLHVSRRITPLLPKLLPAASLVSRTPDAIKNIDLLAAAFGPVVDVFSQLPDDDVDFVIGNCLSVVTRRQGNTWVATWNVASKSPMFDDIDMVILLQIAVKVIWDNLGPFIRGFTASAAAENPEAA